MKKIVSVSLGSSKRDYSHNVNIMGESYHVERIGTNGSFNNAINIIKELDGKVDAFGLGGIDLFLQTKSRRYVIKEALPLKRAAVQTPVYDGSVYKNTLEKSIVLKLMEERVIDFRDKQVLITSALDRYGMAEALKQCGSKVTIGDLMFSLKCNIPIYSLNTLDIIAKLILPIVTKLPFRMLYPIGQSQYENIDMFNDYYSKAEIIAGDYHYIKRYMPLDLRNKCIITNTVTQEDVEQLKSRGVKLLITTTPKLGERSFGTNVMEAMIETIINERKNKKIELSYSDVYDEVGLKPRVEFLC